MSITKGELVGIFGPSGAGKTTLLSIIGGLLEPTSGTVIVDDVDIAELTSKQLVTFRREIVGYLWQLPEDNLISGISILKNVMLPLQIANKNREEQKTIANELLDRVGLSQRKNHKPNQISGGEAQRAAIAVSLANKP
ncbi:MAG: ABC transporter ATP-binding protein, partial [Candidatus Heimdallarchaeota archaeon]